MKPPFPTQVWYDLVTGEPAGPPLHPGGDADVVTSDNVRLYVEETAERILLGAVRREVAAFLAGLDAVLGDHRKLLTHADFQLLLSGVDVLDVSDMRDHTAVDFGALEDIDPRPNRLVHWFFDLVADWDDETRGRVLLFATGFSRVPPGGFARFKPPLTLKFDPDADASSLPTAHTCFNALTLPLYATKADLSAKLNVALAHGTGHFGLR